MARARSRPQASGAPGGRKADRGARRGAFPVVLLVVLVLVSCEAETEPPGRDPLSDTAAAALVDPHPYEVRAENLRENGRKPFASEMAQFREMYAPGGGARFNELRAHVTGGCEVALRDRFGRRPTTHELIQCAAHKWGFNQDTVYAQAVAESYWFMDALGDYDDDHCAPGYSPPCPNSFGLMQIKWWTLPGSFPVARASTAGHLDIYGFVLRANFEGVHPWWPCAPTGSMRFALKLWWSGDCNLGNWYADRVYRIRGERTWETAAFDQDSTP